MILHQLDPLVKSLRYHVSEFRFSPSFCEPLRLAHIQEFTTTRKGCQALTVSRFAVSRSCRSEPLGSVASQILPQPRRVVNPPQYVVSRYHVYYSRQPLRSPSHSGVYHNSEGLSSPRGVAFLSIAFLSSEPRRFVAFQILPQLGSVVKPPQYRVSQYPICESSWFSRSVCGFWARSPFPARFR